MKLDKVTLTTVTEVPPRLVLPLVFRQTILRSRLGRLELLKSLQSYTRTSDSILAYSGCPNITIVTPSGEFKCTLEEATEAIKAIEGGV